MTILSLRTQGSNPEVRVPNSGLLRVARKDGLNVHKDRVGSPRAIALSRVLYNKALMNPLVAFEILVNCIGADITNIVLSANVRR